MSRFNDDVKELGYGLVDYDIALDEILARGNEEELWDSVGFPIEENFKKLVDNSDFNIILKCTFEDNGYSYDEEVYNFFANYLMYALIDYSYSH